MFPISVVLSLEKFQSCPADDQCRILAFPWTLFFVGERLINHTIANISVIDRDTCEYRCYLDYNCVSVNFYFGENGAEAHNCELNNSTAKKYEEDLVKAVNYVYHGTKNFCHRSPCQNNATCQSGFTKKQYRCLCASGFTGHDCEEVYKDCAEVYKNGQKLDGIYKIDPDGEGAFDVYCYQKKGRGGWTVFQRKYGDSIDFNRDWIDYKNGFGDLSGDFWLGLDKVHRLTKNNNYTLRMYWKIGEPKQSSVFDHFAVESEETRYRLKVEGSGNVWWPLKDSNGQNFTTRDQDSNDQRKHTCVNHCGIGWWYRSTLPTPVSCHCPVGFPNSKKSGMMIRPTIYSPIPDIKPAAFQDD